MIRIIIIYLISLISFNAFAQTFTLVKPDPTGILFNSNSITDVLIDNNNIVCYTRGDSALAIYDGTNWTYKGYSAFGFSGNHSSSMELDIAPNGDYWLACFKGLDVFNGTSVANMTVANSNLKNDYFTDLSIDNNGKTFIGYGNGFGLSMIENGTWTQKGSFTGNFTPLNSVSNAPFIEVNKQTNETWILSNDNFFKINNNNLTTYTGASTVIPSSSSNNVSGMTVTDNGSVWFSLRSNSNNATEGGLISFDGTNWTHYNTDNSSIPSNNITAITAYKNQVIFNHYSVSGISVFEGTTWTLYDGTNGTNFPLNSSYFVHDMKALDNTVYMGTNSGLFIMELPEIVSFDEKETKRLAIYPNPTFDFVTIDSELENLSVEVCNSLGNIVLAKQLKGNKLIVTSLPKGAYIATFKSKGKFLATRKLIKK